MWQKLKFNYFAPNCRLYNLLFYSYNIYVHIYIYIDLDLEKLISKHEKDIYCKSQKWRANIHPISGFAFVCSCISVNIIHLLQKICWSRTFMHIYNNVTEMVQHFRIMTKYEKQASTYIIKNWKKFFWADEKLSSFRTMILYTILHKKCFDFQDFWKIWL